MSDHLPEVSAAFFPFQHLILAQPERDVVRTAALCIGAILLGAAAGWLVLCLLPLSLFLRLGNGLAIDFGSSCLPSSPSQTIMLCTLSTASYKIDLKRTSRGHLLAFSMTNQLYLGSARGKVYKERQCFLSDQPILLEKQTDFWGLKPFIRGDAGKATFKAKYTLKTFFLSSSH